MQVGAVDQVHDQGEQIALDDEVAGAHDVRVGEAEQDGALAQEAHHDVRVVRQLLLEDLDRDGLAGLARHGRLGARGLPLAGSPDGARGAAPERLLEQVLAAYRPHVMRSLLIVSDRRSVVVSGDGRLAPVVPSRYTAGPRGCPTHCSAADRGRPSVCSLACTRPVRRSRRRPMVAERPCRCVAAVPDRSQPGTFTARADQSRSLVAGRRACCQWQVRGCPQHGVCAGRESPAAVPTCRVGGITGRLPCRAPRAEGTADGDADPADRPRAAQRPVAPQAAPSARCDVLVTAPAGHGAGRGRLRAGRGRRRRPDAHRPGTVVLYAGRSGSTPSAARWASRRWWTARCCPSRRPARTRRPTPRTAARRSSRSSPGPTRAGSICCTAARSASAAPPTPMSRSTTRTSPGCTAR